MGSGRLNLGFRRPDLGCGRPAMRSLRLDLGSSRHDLGFWRPDLESGRPDLGMVDVENETRLDTRLSKSRAGVQGQ